MTELALFEALTLARRVDANGTVRYCNTLGKLHREYGPAVEYADGEKFWYYNGQRHIDLMGQQLNTQTAAASGGKMGNAIDLMGLQLNM